MNTTEFTSLQRHNDTENPALTPSCMDLDPQKYLGYLDGFDMSDSQKRELLETLWSIMRSFVELGFDVKACGQLIESFKDASEAESDGDMLSHSTSMEKSSTDSDDGGNA